MDDKNVGKVRPNRTIENQVYNVTFTTPHEGSTVYYRQDVNNPFTSIMTTLGDVLDNEEQFDFGNGYYPALITGATTDPQWVKYWRCQFHITDTDHFIYPMVVMPDNKILYYNSGANGKHGAVDYIRVYNIFGANRSSLVLSAKRLLGFKVLSKKDAALYQTEDGTYVRIKDHIDKLKAVWDDTTKEWKLDDVVVPKLYRAFNSSNVNSFNSIQYTSTPLEFTKTAENRYKKGAGDYIIDWFEGNVNRYENRSRFSNDSGVYVEDPAGGQSYSISHDDLIIRYHANTHSNGSNNNPVVPSFPIYPSFRYTSRPLRLNTDMSYPGQDTGFLVGTYVVELNIKNFNYQYVPDSTVTRYSFKDIKTIWNVKYNKRCRKSSGKRYTCEREDIFSHTNYSIPYVDNGGKNVYVTPEGFWEGSVVKDNLPQFTALPQLYNEYQGEFHAIDQDKYVFTANVTFWFNWYNAQYLRFSLEYLDTAAYDEQWLEYTELYKPNSKEKWPTVNRLYVVDKPDQETAEGLIQTLRLTGLRKEDAYENEAYDRTYRIVFYNGDTKSVPYYFRYGGEYKFIKTKKGGTLKCAGEYDANVIFRNFNGNKFRLDPELFMKNNLIGQMGPDYYCYLGGDYMVEDKRTLRRRRVFESGFTKMNKQLLEQDHQFAAYLSNTQVIAVPERGTIAEIDIVPGVLRSGNEYNPKVYVNSVAPDLSLGEPTYTIMTKDADKAGKSIYGNFDIKLPASMFTLDNRYYVVVTVAATPYNLAGNYMATSTNMHEYDYKYKQRFLWKKKTYHRKGKFRLFHADENSVVEFNDQFRITVRDFDKTLTIKNLSRVRALHGYYRGQAMNLSSNVNMAHELHGGFWYRTNEPVVISIRRILDSVNKRSADPQKSATNLGVHLGFTSMHISIKEI